MKKTIALLTVAAMAAPGLAQGPTVFALKSANQLRAECNSEPSTARPDLIVRRMACVAYISGVIDAVEDYRVRVQAKRVFCLPRDASAIDAVSVVQIWLNQNSQFKRAAADAVMQAMRENYPCD